MLRPTLPALFVASVAGHGALVTPPSRNAVDRFLPKFQGGKSEGYCSCNCGNATAGCDAGIREPGGGQPCLWFSQGCSIGCDKCTGIGSHSAVNICGSDTQPTLPYHAWTMNRGVVDGSADDSYRYNPWRKPGAAPVNDACGMAGGTVPSQAGPGEAIFNNNSFASMGDLGSRALPTAPSGTIWKAGEAVEVTWGIRFNHGGGYQYRLCAADEPLTEACFQKTPLAFDRAKQSLVWNNGTRLPIEGTFVDQGTVPAGSTWAMNPIPRIDFDSISSGQPKNFSGCDMVNGLPTGKACRQFEPPCPWDNGWYAQPPYKTNVDVEGACSGDWTSGVISDFVLIPKDLPAGDCAPSWELKSPTSRSAPALLAAHVAPRPEMSDVLGWRWDCEEYAASSSTHRPWPHLWLCRLLLHAPALASSLACSPLPPRSTQVWSNCADVTVVSGEVVEAA